MLVGAILMVVYLIKSPLVGGLTEGIRRLSAIDPNLTSITMGGWEKWQELIPILMVTSLAPLGMPQMIQKFFAIDEKPKSIFYATVVCTISAFIIIMGMHLVGYFVHLFFNEIPIDPQTLLPNADLLLPKMLEQFMPELALAFVFILIAAASMSTLAGLVMVSSSSISVDLLKGYLKPEMSDEKVTLIMKVLCVVFVFLSLIIAVIKPASLLILMSVAWGAISGFFLAPCIYGVLWKGTTKTGALTGGITGVLIAIVLPLFFGVNATLAAAFAMGVPLLLVPIVSLFTAKLSKDHLSFVFSQTQSAAIVKKEE